MAEVIFVIDEGNVDDKPDQENDKNVNVFNSGISDDWSHDQVRTDDDDNYRNYQRNLKLKLAILIQLLMPFEIKDRNTLYGRLEFGLVLRNINSTIIART